MVSGIIIVLITLVIHFFTTEVNPINHDLRTFGEMWTVLKNLLINKNVRNLLLFYLVCRIGFAPVEAVFSPTLIREGLSAYVLVNISTLIFPFQFFVLPWIGKIAKRNKEFIIWWIIFAFHIVKDIYMYFVLLYANPAQHYNTTVILVFIANFQDILFTNGQQVCQGAVHNRIADTDVAGIFLSRAI